MRWLVALLVGNVQQVLQMLDGRMDVTILAVGLGQLPVSFSSLCLIIGFFTQGQEFVQELDRLLEVAELLMNVPNLLVALGFLQAVLSSLGGIKALLEELERLVEVVHVLELNGYNLVHSNELHGNLLLNFLNVTVDDFLEGGFQIVFGVEDVEYLLLAAPEPLVGLSFTDDILRIDTCVKAFLVEVGGGFIVVKFFKMLSHNSVLLQAFLYVVFPEVALGVLQVLAQI